MLPQPPDHEHGDADELARRRAIRDDRGARTPEEALREAEERLGAVAAERDALRERLTGVEQELTRVRQREWSEQQQRVETQGEAAAARELAAGQVADLRQRLALAEAELANAVAERDRALEAVTGETTRREQLEAREDWLRRELDRRTELAVRAGDALAEARGALARREDEGADVTALEARLVSERAAFAARVAVVEEAVAAVRDRLPAAARALHERLADERAGRIAAESALAVEREAARRARMEAAWLEGELARRAEAEAELRAALDDLRAELDVLRLGDDERERRLAARIEDVQTIATVLRAGVERERAAEHQALNAALETMQAHLAELQAHASSAAAAVREELEAERAARAAAEARVAELEAEVGELREAGRPAGPDPEALASLREALDQLRRTEPAPADPSVADDLAAAAQRLRESSDQPGTEASDPAGSGPALPEAPAAAASVAAPERHTLPARGPVDRSGPWLRDGLLGLAADEPEVAELVVVALLGAQAGLVRRSTTYDLAITGGGTHRVTIDPSAVRVDRPDDDATPPGARVSGSLSALIPLAAGGAGRRLAGAEIEGRWTLRRLLKGRRDPLPLTALTRVGVTVAPGLLLTLLASAVPASSTVGETLAVDIAPEGTDRWRVTTRPTGGLAVEPAPEQPASATLHTTAAQLPAVLAGTLPASVEGDQRAVRTLLAWLDRAQRADR